MFLLLSLSRCLLSKLILAVCIRIYTVFIFQFKIKLINRYLLCLYHTRKASEHTINGADQLKEKLIGLLYMRVIHKESKNIFSRCCSYMILIFRKHSTQKVSCISWCMIDMFQLLITLDLKSFRVKSLYCLGSSSIIFQYFFVFFYHGL